MSDTKAIKEEIEEIFIKEIKSIHNGWTGGAIKEIVALFASHNQSLREQIKELPAIGYMSLKDDHLVGETIEKDAVLSLLNPPEIPDSSEGNIDKYLEEKQKEDHIHAAVKEAAIATEYCPTHKEYHGVHKLLDKSFIQTAKKAQEVFEEEKSWRPGDLPKSTHTASKLPIEKPCECFWYKKDNMTHLMQCNKCGKHGMIFECPCHCHHIHRKQEDCADYCSHCSPEKPKEEND